MKDTSLYTKQLIEATKKIVNALKTDDSEAINISKTVSFFAIIYEKLRNVLEFKDEHLIRRTAISRIVNRKHTFNPDLTDEASSIAKEIAWSRYYRNDRIPESLIHKLERTIEWHIQLGKIMKTQVQKDFIWDLLICSIEYIIAENELELKNIFLFYFYQQLNNSVAIEGIDPREKDLHFYVALDRTFLKSDSPYLRFHLMKVMYEELLKVPPNEFANKRKDFEQAFSFIDGHISLSPDRRIMNFAKNIRPIFLVLQEFVVSHVDTIEEYTADESKFITAIEDICSVKYEITKKRLTKQGIKSILYIFFTKVIFVFIAEYPIMVQIGEGIDYVALAINALLPPIIMALFVLFSRVPGEDNTKRIIDRMKAYVYGEGIQKVTFREKKFKTKGLFSSSLFWFFHLAAYAITFISINSLLDLLAFPLTSKFIFFFFITAVCFFGFRVVQIAKEYTVKEREGISGPIIDFFMMPLISVGKLISSGVSKINFLLFIFDYLIEAPFKVLFEVVEDWIDFIRKRKEDISH